MDGLLMCAKYAFPPNLLKLCGPNDNKALFESMGENENTDELKNLLLQFEGAVPYLRLIAQKNNIEDIFDKKVVEAYWLGNKLLAKVEMKDITPHTEERFKEKMKKKEWSWLIAGSLPKAKPFHAFHVFDIYRRTGFLKSGKVEKLIDTIDNCRIGWGKVLDTESGTAIIEYRPVVFEKNKLKLGEKKTKRYFSLGSSVKKGDQVSLHWEYVCDKLEERQKKNLAFWTKFHLDLTNQTL